MMKINKKGVVLIYVLVLINVAMVMALVALNNASILSNNSTYQNIERELYNTISLKSNSSIKYQSNLNKDGIGFSDIIRCPNDITMSGNTLKTTGIVSILTFSGSTPFCSGSYSSSAFNIFFNSTNTGYLASSYLGNSVGLSTDINGMIGSSTFPDPDNTLISFPFASFQAGDSIDDDFNSDDYKSSSTGIVEYPGYLDNDDLGRKEVFGYISKIGVFENIFWNNIETNTYIDLNSNNTGSLNINISQVLSGSLFINVDKNFSLKIVKFDRSKYTKNSRELFPLETFYSSGTILSSSGYIQNIAGVLTITGSINSNTTFLNFKDFDYAVFISNKALSGSLYYKLSGTDNNGKKIYINPINDSYVNRIKYLGNHIITNSGNIYIGKQFEIFGLK